jgi:hypothetical protein
MYNLNYAPKNLKQSEQAKIGPVLVVRGDDKVNLPLCLNNYHAIKIYIVLNQTPRHEYVWGVWRYSSTHS